MSYLDSLNDVQRQAVTNMDGPLLIVAGPGSGKTRVLTYRIAHLIKSGVPPWEILALTFTNKAAREMKERIGAVVGNKANNVWAGTFHSVFAKILRIEAEKIGFPSNFSIYDSDDTKGVISSVIKEMGLDLKVYSPNAIKSRISSAKSQLITPIAYAKIEDLLTQDRMAKRPQIHKIYKKYVDRCKRAGAMDFDDLLLQLFKLLYKNPDNVLAKYQKKFKHILVDEFQDTNHLQYAIIKRLLDYRTPDGNSDLTVQRNITAVGDDAQSIYAFRGATIDNILDYEKDFKKFGIKVFKLEQNYRSTDHIVQAANELISNNDKQIPKKIWSDKGEGNKITLIKALTDGEEGRRVADTIIEQKSRYHLSNSDIAILYRTNSQSRIFEEYLRRQNLNYKVFGGQSFYQRKEVKDLVAYMRLVVNPKDEEALRRIINYPKRAIGKTTLDKLSAFAAEKDVTMWQAIPHFKATGKARTSIDAFIRMINNFHSKLEDINAFDLAVLIARKCGLIDLLKRDNTPEGQTRLENVQALLDGVKDFVETDEVFGDIVTEDKSLSSYLQTIALHTDQDEKNDSTDFVTLMSVHAAKGLEYKSVFVVGLEEDLFPSFMSKDDPKAIDEERRLFYVAITRAEEFLAITHATSRYRFGSMRSNPPSRFLQEIDPKHLDNVTPVFRRMAPETASSGPQTSGVKGNFSRMTRNVPALLADPSTFSPSPTSDIEKGMTVLHLKFGKGKVIDIDGNNATRVATIKFEQLGNTEKRIMLKFAKLQIL